MSYVAHLDITKQITYTFELPPTPVAVTTRNILYIFSRESRTKPSLAIGILGAGRRSKIYSAVVVSLRIQVCPKEGITPIILF